MLSLIAACLAIISLQASAFPMQNACARDVIQALGLEPNQEKGYYRQTFIDPESTSGNRSYSSAIYYLLEGEVGASYWHKVDAVEIWSVESCSYIYMQSHNIF